MSRIHWFDGIDFNASSIDQRKGQKVRFESDYQRATCLLIDIVILAYDCLGKENNVIYILPYAYCFPCLHISQQAKIKGRLACSAKRQ